MSERFRSLELSFNSPFKIQAHQSGWLLQHTTIYRVLGHMGSYRKLDHAGVSGLREMGSHHADPTLMWTLWHSFILRE